MQALDNGYLLLMKFNDPSEIRHIFYHEINIYREELYNFDIKSRMNEFIYNDWRNQIFYKRIVESNQIRKLSEYGHSQYHIKHKSYKKMFNEKIFLIIYKKSIFYFLII